MIGVRTLHRAKHRHRLIELSSKPIYYIYRPA